MANRARFEKLMEPSRIGQVPTRNRIIKTASGTGFINDDGTVSEALKNFYETLAKGGVGLIIFEYCTVEFPRGAFRRVGQAHLSDDKYIPGYSELTNVVHKHQCPIFIQLMHSGCWYEPSQTGEPGDRIAPSALTKEELPGPIFIPPRAPSTAEVEELVDTFGKAAARAQKAGFDGVEINGSHHHLVNSFFSRFWNRRQDAYGGSLENRARFMVEIIRAIKKRCGRDYPVATLINALEYGIENGITLEETKKVAQLLQDAGADSIQLRACGYGELDIMLHAERFFYPELPEKVRRFKELDWSRKGKGFLVPIAIAVKEVVSIPVYVAGRLDHEIGEELLQQGKLDFVAMTRRLFADPELPNKINAGRLEDIAPCAGCNYCWHIRAHQSKPLQCRINAAIGIEGDYEIKSAEKKKRVLIAGGGVAGMEAARVAALRGHEVFLYDRDHKLGGSMRLAAVVKEFECEEILDTIRYFKTQMNKLGVTIRLGKEVNLSVIKEIKPDVIILATGGLPAIPEISGINHRKVINSSELHRMLKTALRFFGPRTLEQLTKWWMPIGKRVVIVGGALQGCQLAEFLLKRGRKVTLVDTAETLGAGLLADDPMLLFKWLDQKGATLIAGVNYEEITGQGLIITTKEGERKTLEADTILTALPLLPDTNLLRILKGEAPEIYQIGDCREPNFIHEAIADGWHVARAI
jgi:2,4-dienoyl-CoA reductase (NADPH2)